MPRGVRTVVEDEEVFVEIPAKYLEVKEEEVAVVEEDVVEVPTEVVEEEVAPRATGKFEKLQRGGEYFLVNVDGRILSSACSEEQIDAMVKKFNK